MADEGTENLTDEEKLVQKHKQERKELQAEIQKLKRSVPKGDKKRKKEITTQIAKLEAELDERHNHEIDQIRQVEVSAMRDAMNSLATDDAKENEHNMASIATAGSQPNDNVTKSKKISKAQKRRDQKIAKLKEREELIRQQEIENEHGVRNMEAKNLKEKLAQRDLSVSEVPSDGNCLYAAVCDQLKQQGIENSIENLRKETAVYMRTHVDSFLPFLCKADTGDPYTPDEFEAYCTELESTPAWGGQLEIMALSHVLKHPIEVVQADVSSVISGEEYQSKPLIVTYHRHSYKLGEHYNSVQPKCQEEDDEFS